MIQINSRVEIKTDVQKYRVFEGKLTGTIPRLVNGTDENGNRIEIPRDLMDFYLLLDERVNGKDPNDKATFRSNYFVVGDVWVANPDSSEEGIIAPYTNKTVRELVNFISQKSKLTKDYSLTITQEQYEAIKQGEFVVVSAETAQELRMNIYSNTAKRQEIYELLCRGKKELITGNLEAVAEARGVATNTVSLDNAMGLYPADKNGLRPLWIWSVGYGNSNVVSNYDLGCNIARPVGVLPEAFNAKILGAKQQSGGAK